MKRTLLVLCVFPLFGAAANAHHSYTNFYDHHQSMVGTIQTMAFANPHTVLTIKAENGDVYTAHWRAALQLQRMGVKPTELKVGDRVLVSGTPSRDPASHELARLNEVRRLADGWTWRLDSEGRVSLTASP